MDLEFLLFVLGCAAFFAGFVDSIVGGGGLIQIPALFAAYPNALPASLFGTNKLASIVGTTSAAIQYGRRVSIQWRLAGPGAVAALIGAWYGAKAVAYMPPSLLRPLVLGLLVLVAIYIAYQAVVAILQPGRCPSIVRTGPVAAERMLWSLLVPVALIVAVLGSILFGLATPTESASVGAVGTVAICALRRRLGGDTLVETMRATLRMTSMIYVILFGASVFSLVFIGLGGEKLVHDTLHALPGGATAAMAVVMLLVFLLGFALDFIEIVVIVVPIVGPALLVMGIDPLWLGIMLAVNLQTSFLTPPLGPALFYLRGVAPPEVSSKAMYAGAWPFVWLQLLGLGVLWLFPGLATWLPSVLLD